MRTARQKHKSRDRENKKRREAKKGTARPGVGTRKLTLASGEWRWEAGKTSLSVRSPAGKRVVVFYTDLTGKSWHELEWDPVIVTPSLVRSYIEGHLLPTPR